MTSPVPSKQRIPNWLYIVLTLILPIYGFVADTFGIRSAISERLGQSQFPKIIAVSSNNQDGYQFTINDSGTYTFKYVEGAYDVARHSEANDDWRSEVMLYIDNEVPRVGDDNKPDRTRAAGLIGGRYKHATEDAAIAEANLDSSTASLHLNKGDKAILVVSDKYGFYGDNNKNVRVEIEFNSDN